MIHLGRIRCYAKLSLAAMLLALAIPPSTPLRINSAVNFSENLVITDSAVEPAAAPAQCLLGGGGNGTSPHGRCEEDYTSMWTWHSVGGSLPTNEISGVFVDPTDELILYVTAVEAGLFVTRDGGETWDHPLRGILYSEGLAVDPADSGTVYAGVSRSLHVSRDHGRTWEKLGRFPDPVTAVLVSAVDGSLLVAQGWSEEQRPGCSGFNGERRLGRPIHSEGIGPS